MLLILTENFIFWRTIMWYLKKSTAEPRRCHPHLKHYGFVVIEFFYPLSRFLLWPQCCGGEALFFVEGSFSLGQKFSFKMIILARSRAKETNGTKVWCMAWLKTNSRPEGTKHHEIIFLSTRCFLLMQFSRDQPIKIERSKNCFLAQKWYLQCEVWILAQK